ncbi:unnamed protein product [Adineta steineri]|uniref:Uncharacterized protein n=1 Tax=Adineta steineri TaxID=433720 RepID=A0A819VTS4_9BILA|nr:unnamed protein product [Adineta steineri]
MIGNVKYSLFNQTYDQCICEMSKLNGLIRRLQQLTQSRLRQQAHLLRLRLLPQQVHPLRLPQPLQQVQALRLLRPLQQAHPSLLPQP